MNKAALTTLVTSVLLVACSRGSEPILLVHENDPICIGANFYVVGETKSFPWVKLDPNNKCSDKANLPSTYVNFDKVESFQPNCVCRYSAACKKKCGIEDTCLETCRD
ncbi:MAG TPA: hypothetical protein VER11_29760 [Polyangiaceae bacterium]|nr:hypothetical protein [Polyangiaceae bacterium]